MNLSVKTGSCLTLALLVLGATGCQTQKIVAPVGHGYEEVSHNKSRAWLDEPESPRISLQYRGADGKITPIWPALYVTGEVIQDDRAIFVGERGYVDDGDRVTHPRLFAVQAPALPLDITEEVLWRWSKSAGKDFGQAVNRCSLITPEAKEGGLAVHLEFSSQDYLAVEKNWPDTGDLQLSWPQVEAIMHAVKTKGVEGQDLRWHTPYIGEQF